MLATSAEKEKGTVLSSEHESESQVRFERVRPITRQVLLRSENILSRLFRFQSGAGSMLSKPERPRLRGPIGASGRKNFIAFYIHRPGLLHQGAQTAIISDGSNSCWWP